ncbi:ATP-binding protein [Streptomyces sp. NPDC001780]
MCGFEKTRPLTRCVLPFEANPAELGALRTSVRVQLQDWGVPTLVDEVQLAVTELATNVLKHVGYGVPATLVLEPGGDRLRVEVHDTSPIVPTLRQAECADECGRGLHLLAAMALSWGTVLTAAGKAVWCELPFSSAKQCSRAQRASAVLGTYQSLPGAPSGLDIARLPVAEDCAAGLIADILHWLASHGGDPEAMLDWAQMHYEADAA